MKERVRQKRIADRVRRRAYPKCRKNPWNVTRKDDVMPLSHPFWWQDRICRRIGVEQ